VAREDDHKLLKEVLPLEIKDKEGRLHLYQWIDELPLNGNKHTLWVDSFEYGLMNEGRPHIITVGSRILEWITRICRSG
jgi:hypothetical protein